MAAVIVGLPVLALGLPATTAAAATVGTVTIHSLKPNSRPNSITAGPDGALWFTNTGHNQIGRITTAGVITTYTHPGINGPVGITAGPDGAMWFTNYNGSSLGRITTADG